MVKIQELNERHLPELWDIVKTYPGFFSDEVSIKTFSDFKGWFRQSSKSAIIGVDDNKLVGCSYLDCLKEGSLGSINIVFRRHFDPAKKIILARLGLEYFFHKHKLKFIYGVVRKENKACGEFMRSLGFIFTETLRSHKTVGGRKTDYVLGGILNANLS